MSLFLVSLLQATLRPCRLLRTRRRRRAAEPPAQVRSKVRVTVASATESAKAKIEAAGGQITLAE